MKGKKTVNFPLNPTINYIDDLSEKKVFKPEPIILEVSPAKPAFEILPGRIATGYLELDRLLYGGIPKNYAVILSSPSFDERALIISKFLEVGSEQNEITLYITVDAEKSERMAQQFQTSFFTVVCNPLTDTNTKTCQTSSK
jgi:hypothetical protein